MRRVLGMLFLCAVFSNIYGVFHNSVDRRDTMFERSLLRYRYTFYQEYLHDIRAHTALNFERDQRSVEQRNFSYYLGNGFQNHFQYFNFLWDGMWFVYEHIPVDKYYNLTRKYYFDDISLMKFENIGAINLNVERLTKGKTFLYLRIPLK